MKRLAFILYGVPGLAVAHPGHDAPLFHTHQWEIGLALAAAAVMAVLVYRIYRKKK